MKQLRLCATARRTPFSLRVSIWNQLRRNLAANSSFVGEPIALGGGVGMGVRESDTELKETFDAVIGELKADGTLDELIVKWFGEDAQIYE